MARTTKKGLSYFPLDVDFFDDDKIELINAQFGIKGENIALRLLCLIYKNSYWYRLGEDESLLLAKRIGNGVTGSLVSDVVKGLVKRSFFDERIFNSFQILTSRGIQDRYFEAVDRRKMVEVIPEIMLISINEHINALNVNINSLNLAFSTQSKEEESKEENLERGQKKPEKPDKPRPKNFKELTETEFFDSLTPFVSLHSKQTVRDFYDYWSEKNTKNKMRFQMEKTWETKKRLRKWKDNEEKFAIKQSKNGIHEPQKNAPTLTDVN